MTEKAIHVAFLTATYRGVPENLISTVGDLQELLFTSDSSISLDSIASGL
jgi:hypothetical protein